MERLYLSETSPQTPPELILPSAQLVSDLGNVPLSFACDDELGGRVFDFCGFDDVSDTMQQLLVPSGFAFRESVDGRTPYSTFLPTPERFAAGCRANNTPVQLAAAADSEGAIPIDLYEAMVQSRSHPIGVDNLSFYTHDLTSHFPAVAVGGKPLIDWIIENAPNTTRLAVVYDEITFLTTNLLRTYFNLRVTDKPALMTTQIGFILNLLNGGDNGGAFFGSVTLIASEDDTRRKGELSAILYNGMLQNGVYEPDILTVAA